MQGTAAVFVFVMLGVAVSGTSRAEVFSRDFPLCMISPGPGCNTIQYWRLGSQGHLTVNVSPKDYDERSVLLAATFDNRTNCSIHLTGTFRLGGVAIAVVEWGNITLAPGESIQGERQVNGLGKMGPGNELDMSLLAATHKCQ